MKFDRLDIQGFGRVRNTSIHFSPHITLIVGDNEAGKSTLHRALRTALYGIDGQRRRGRDMGDWERWAPWEGGPYGLSLTYTLDDGRQLRVARRLTGRKEAVQVVELGGGDFTDALRVGRAVSPGHVHLGFDEAVFCATACVGEESLRLDAPDSAGQHADHLQHFLERLTDSGSLTTAAEAVARLHAAAERIGTERRLQSPLGSASARLRQLDTQLAHAQQRYTAVSREQERLRELEMSAQQATERRQQCERDWLTGRLASLTAQRSERYDAQKELTRLEEAIAASEDFSRFPLEREEALMIRSGELVQARATQRQAEQRWQEVAERVAQVERRRAEIVQASALLAAAPPVSEEALAEASMLEANIRAAQSSATESDTVVAAEAKAAALRQEIAHTGLGAAPPSSVNSLIGLVERAVGDATEGPGPWWTITALGIIGGIVGAVLGYLLVSALAIAVALGTAILALRQHDPAREARHELHRMYPTMDLRPDALRQLRDQLPLLIALHEELAKQDLIAQTSRDAVARAENRAVTASLRTMELAKELRIDVDRPVETDIEPANITVARGFDALSEIRTAAEHGQRRHELVAEDVQLLRELHVYRAIEHDRDHATAQVQRLNNDLAAQLEQAGTAADEDPLDGVANFRQACAKRRQFEIASRRVVEVRKRMATLGSDATLAAQHSQLSAELERRGGDISSIADATPLEPAQLHTLELEADHARQHAAAAEATALGLRERLQGMADNLPTLADLSDEREACIAIRNRALHQLEALQRATDLINEVARKVHLDVAPRLKSALEDRLPMLTNGRYSQVNIDVENFAVFLQTPERPDLVPLHMVSHGTRDQTSLLLRLALADVLGKNGELVPLLLDNPLLSADHSRREAMIEFLVTLSATTQVVLTTSNCDVVAHMSNYAGDGCHVVELPPADNLQDAQDPRVTAVATERWGRSRPPRLRTPGTLGVIQRAQHPHRP